MSKSRSSKWLYRAPIRAGDSDRAGVGYYPAPSARSSPHHDKGFVVSVGTRRGVADIAGISSSGRLAHLLKDLIEWEYRQSVTHLRGWDPLAG